jgi:hypothetical protein
MGSTKIKSDMNGGVYILIYNNSTSTPNSRLQHLEHDGTHTLGGYGYSISGSFYNPDILVLNYNSIIISYYINDTNVVRKLDSNAQTIWTQTIENSIGNATRLLPAGNDDFYILTGGSNGISLTKYSTSGNPIWAEPVIIISQNNVRFMNHRFKMQTINQDGSLTICWGVGTYYVLYAQRISPEGVKIWDEGGVLISDLNSYDLRYCQLDVDGNGGNFLSYSTDFYHTMIHHLSAEGTLWPHRVEIESGGVCMISSFTGNSLRLIWQEYRTPATGIYAQHINLQGDILEVDGGICLQSGFTGYVHLAAMTEIGNRALLAWNVEDINGNSRIYCQVLNQDGSEVYQHGGLCLTDYDIPQVVKILAVSSPDQYSLIVWETNGLGAKIKAQLFGPNLAPVWEEGGKAISQNGINSFVSYDNGAFYIVWRDYDSSNYRKVYGQKFGYLTEQWEPGGRRLVGDVPEYSNFHQGIVSLKGRYLVLDLNQHTYGYPVLPMYVLRFDESGQPCPGFSVFGNEVAEMLVPFLGQYVNQELLIDDDLLIRFNNWGYDEYDYFYSMRLQKVNSYGIQQYGLGGVHWPSNNVHVGFDKIYSVDAGSSFVLLEYDHNNIDQGALYYYTNQNMTNMSYVELTETDANRLLITGLANINGSYKLVHFYFNTQAGTYTIRADVFPAICSDISLCRLGGGTAIKWTSNDNSLKVQFLNNGDVGIDDSAEINTFSGLNGNSPNPFTAETGISYYIARSGHVSMSVYNTKGQLVKQIVNEQQKNGSYSVTWDGTDSHNGKVAAGVYFYRLETAEGARSRKCLLLK